jgi:EmrB/QacA subfamily drug resistance transporter
VIVFPATNPIIVPATLSAQLHATKPGYLLSRRDTILAFTGLQLGLLLSAMNQSIVATALPHIADDLGGLQQYSWVFTVYMLGATVMMPVFGRLSDLHGRRAYFLFGIVLFMAGSVVAASAGTMLQVIIGRGIQGVAAGALLPLSYAALADLIPAYDRGRWQAANSALFAIGSVGGPVAGGWLADHADWRWIFLLSIPLGLAALVVAAATLRIPAHPERAQKVDAPGAVLLAVSLSSLLFVVVGIGARGALLDADIAIPLVAGAVATVGLVAQQRHAVSPFLPRDLVGDRMVRLASATAFAAGAAFFTGMIYIPLFAQRVLGASATGGGLVLGPFMIASFAASIWSSNRITSTGRYRWAIVAGPLVAAVGFGLLAALGEQSSLWMTALASTGLGAGTGLLLWNLVFVVQNSVPPRDVGAGTGLVQLFRSTGGTIAVAVAGAIVTSRLAGGQTRISGATTAGDASELAAALHAVFLLGAPLMLLTCLVAMRITDIPLRRTVGRTP